MRSQVLDTKKVRGLIETKGVSQQTLADLCGVNRSTVSEWLTGRYVPKEKHLRLLADALGEDPMDLLREEQDAMMDVTSGDSGRTGNTVQYVTIETLHVDTIVISTPDGAQTLSEILRSVKHRKESPEEGNQSDQELQTK